MTFSLKLHPGFIKHIKVETAIKLQVASYKPDDEEDDGLMEIYFETMNSSCTLLCTLSKVEKNFAFEMNLAHEDLIKVQGYGTGTCFLMGSYQLSEKYESISDVNPAIVSTTQADAQHIMKAVERDVIKTTSGLIMCDFIKGRGKKAVKNSEIVVHIIGIVPGQLKPFVNTFATKPLSCLLGTGELIPGLDEGIEGMREGGSRNMMVPSFLGFGAEGYDAMSIPANSDLQFEVKLLKVTKPSRFSTAHLYR